MEKTRKMIVLQTNQPTETLSGHDTLDNMQIKNITGQPIQRVYTVDIVYTWKYGGSPILNIIYAIELKLNVYYVP